MANKSTIAGRNIYSDKRGRTIYYDKFTKKGYIIDPQFESKYYTYNNRFTLIALAMILCADYFLTWTQCIAVGLGLCVVVEILFRVNFLKKLRVKENFKPENPRTLLNSVIETQSKKKVYIKLALYIAFAVLIVLNAYLTKSSLPIIIFSVILSLLALYYSLINIIALTKM